MKQSHKRRSYPVNVIFARLPSLKIVELHCSCPFVIFLNTLPHTDSVKIAPKLDSRARNAVRNAGKPPKSANYQLHHQGCVITRVASISDSAEIQSDRGTPLRTSSHVPMADTAIRNLLCDSLQ